MFVQGVRKSNEQIQIFLKYTRGMLLSGLLSPLPLIPDLLCPFLNQR